MSLLRDIEEFAAFTHGKQKDFYLSQLSDAKQVEVVSIYDVFDKDEIEEIKYVVNPEKKMCYKNAHHLTLLYPEKVKYIEGRMSFLGLPIDHAFNKVGDKFVDITLELALEERVEEREYLMFAEYDIKQIWKAAEETGYYGNYYNFYWIKKNIR